MAEQRTLDKIKERRIARLRQGQAVAEIFSLPSDPETRVALVPLTEAEYDACMQATANLPVPSSPDGMETIAGAAMKDRHENLEVLTRAIREPSDFETHIFNDVEELKDALEVNDVNILYELYVQMTNKNSPYLPTLTDEELDNIKKVLETIRLSDLSGRQLFVLMRFLMTLQPEQLTDNLLGFLSTN